MRNQDVARIFYKIADMLEIKGDNPFRIRAYRRAAQNIENLAEDITKVINQGRKIPGIGQDLMQKVKEILQTGTLQMYEELKTEISPGLLDLLAIPGVGPRTAQIIYEHYGVKDLDTLERLCLEHKIQQLPGIKAKTEKNILKGIQLIKKGRERRPLGLILPLAEEIIAILKKKCPVDRIDIAGSVRRCRETVKDIDILICSSSPGQVMDVFTTLPMVGDVIARGKTKSSIRTQDGLQVDLRVVEKDCYGAALCYFTGSKAHNIRMRELALKKGLKINEYGIFKGNKRIGGKEEEEVFKAMDLPYIPPELREDRGEIEAAMEGKLPQLVTMEEIKGDLHVHSKYSDGAGTIAAIAEKAKKIGLEWVAICDHSRSLKVAGGLSIEDLKRKRQEIDAFNRTHADIKLLCGTEVDILNDGSLDYPDEVLKLMDFVVAAIHTGFKQSEATLTNRIIKAMENPYVHSIAHPTGRIIGERETYPLNLDEIFVKASATGTCLEINAYYKRLDLNDTLSQAAKKHGIKFTIGTDAHILDQMEFLRLGVFVARRGWLEKGDVINTMSYQEIMAFLCKRKTIK
ncbi:MAG: DNA polymerase/3'-5' exonuclease PolX [Candidatus Desulfofervidaceae bacterium]|nr:DNA polymerase/3'-5' exonuclease PolX [Candidatus Desulfofervidaceae bacterium]